MSMRSPTTSGVSGARALVLAAILFAPSAAVADPPVDPSGVEPDVSAEDCERARLCHVPPVSRAGCFEEDRRCRVYRARHPEAPAPRTPVE